MLPHVISVCPRVLSLNLDKTFFITIANSVTNCTQLKLAMNLTIFVQKGDNDRYGYNVHEHKKSPSIWLSFIWTSLDLYIGLVCTKLWYDIFNFRSNKTGDKAHLMRILCKSPTDIMNSRYHYFLFSCKVSFWKHDNIVAFSFTAWHLDGTTWVCLWRLQVG